MSADLPIQMFDLPKKSRRQFHHRVATGNEPSVAVLIRLPRDLLDRLDAMAAANYRSRTAEIQLCLEASMENQSIDEHGVIVQRIPAARK
jgi:hypothetical protein